MEYLEKRKINKTLLVISLLMSWFVIFSINYVGKIGTWKVFSPVTDNAEAMLQFTQDSVILKFLCGMISISNNKVDFSFLFVLVAWFAIYYVLTVFQNKRPGIICIIICSLFGINQVLGISAVDNNNLNAVVKNGYQLFISVICMIGYGCIAYICYLLISHILRSGILKKSNISDSNTASKISLIWDNHTFVCASIIIFIAYLPYLIFNYPGSIAYDVTFAAGSYYGEPNMHHPILTTWLYVFLFKLGSSFGIMEQIIFLYVLVQTIISAIIFGKIIEFTNSLNLRRGVQIAVTIFYALVPMFGMYAQWMVKDTIFSIMFGGFILYAARLLFEDYTYNASYQNKLIRNLLIISFIVCSFRYNGIHSVIPALVLIGLYLIKKRGYKLLIGALLILLVNTVINNYAINDLGYKTKSDVDQYSICIQQLANYISKYGDDISPEEMEALDKVIAYEYFEKYSVVTSDSVKVGNVFRNPSKDDYKALLQIWLNKFFKHPGCYFEAFYYNSSGYYLPYGNDVWYEHMQYCTNNADKNTLEGIYGPSINHDTPVLRWITYFNTILFEKMPLIGILQSMGLYTWLVISFVCCFIKNKANNIEDKKRIILLIVPMAILFLICCISPVITQFRYFEGDIIATIIILAITLSKNQI